MPIKCQCKEAVGHLCQKTLTLVGLLNHSPSVCGIMFMCYSTCLEGHAGLCQVSHAWELLVWGLGCWQPGQAAGDRLCKGNVLRCWVGRAARLVSRHALSENLGTCLPSGVTSIRHLHHHFLSENTAKWFVVVVPFASVASVPAPEVEISGCSTVRSHSTASLTMRLLWPENSPKVS